MKATMVRMCHTFVRGCLIGLMTVGVTVGPAFAAREGALKADPSDELFTNDLIRHLRIEIGEADMAILRQPVARNRNAGERPAVSATVREGALVWSNVSVHLKGSLGSFRPVDDKPALTLNFDKLANGQRFHGLQKISLNNSVQDPSYLNEKICREVYRAAGVPTPRTDYATAELNGRNLGLFVLAEGWNKQFLKRHFQNTKGNFYDLGGSHDVHLPMDAAFGENPTNHAALDAVKAAATERDHTKRLVQLRRTVDLDRFITMHALDVLMWHWDGYGLNRNNYRMFHDMGADQIVFFPHGVDQMFWKANGPIFTGRSGLVAKSLLETTEGRRLYLERLTELHTNVLDVSALTNRVWELTARLKPTLVKQGTLVMARQQQAAQQSVRLMAARARDVKAQLESVKSFARIELNAARPLTNWTKSVEFTEANAFLTRSTTSPLALRIQVNEAPAVGAWTTTIWLEEGRYRIEGRVKTLGVRAESSDAGAGFRVWSSRKDTRGASWGWFPYSSVRDSRVGGLIPVFTNTVQQRVVGDKEWTDVAHEFELRQPLADVQIQCALNASAGAAWFDLASLRIRRVALSVSRSTARGE